MRIHAAMPGLVSCLLAVAVSTAPAAFTAEDDGDDAPADRAAQPATGKSTVTWPLPDREQLEDAYAAIARRQGVKVAPPPADADSDPTYELYVPPDYEPGRPFGLMVWIAPSGIGRVPGSWPKVLDDHHLIWVGPNNVGNDKEMVWRTYMAFEAVRQAKLHFAIDDERIYVAGMSGGGRIASHAAILGADTFAGGYYVVGCNFWRHVPSGEPRRMYAGFWRRPDSKLLKTARSRNRYVLLTGSDDFNRANTKAIYKGYVKDRFAHVTYIEVPGMGHEHPNAYWFEQGIEALDEPLTPPEELLEQAAEFEKRKKLGEACLAYTRAAARGAGKDFAEEAAEKVAALRAGYDDQVARVRELIDGGKMEKAAAENAALKHRYGPLAAEQAKAFTQEINRTKSLRRRAPK